VNSDPDETAKGRKGIDERFFGGEKEKDPTGCASPWGAGARGLGALPTEKM